MNYDLGYSVAALANWLSGHNPGWCSTAIAVFVIHILPFLAVVLPIAGLATLAERKIAAAMQRRVGPNHVRADGLVALMVGLSCFWLDARRQAALVTRILHLPGLGWILEKSRRLGLIQLAADGVKSIAKEDIIPTQADAPVFRAAPYLALAGSLLAFVVLPVSQHWCMADLSVGAVYVEGVTGLVVVGLLMAGWGSNNKWSLFGGMRAVAIIVSYEIPLTIAIGAVALWSGTLSLTQMVVAQFHPGTFSLLGWNIFQSPFLLALAVIWVIASLAECNRTPFDLAEADSELVAGFNTEYSGMRWVLFALTEYIDMFLAGALFAVLFLGGYQSPIGEAWILALPAPLETALHAGILLAKISGMILFMIWLRWTLPRFRLDQAMILAWTRLVPIALVCLLALAVSALLAGRGAEAMAYGRFTTASGIASSGQSQLFSWLVGGGLLAALVFWSRYRSPGLPPELIRLTTARKKS